MIVHGYVSLPEGMGMFLLDEIDEMGITGDEFGAGLFWNDPEVTAILV